MDWANLSKAFFSDLDRGMENTEGKSIYRVYK
jgi:hypothetical protein